MSRPNRDHSRLDKQEALRSRDSQREKKAAQQGEVSKIGGKKGRKKAQRGEKERVEERAGIIIIGSVI